MRRYPVKRTRDGRAMLNLGCGYVTHPEWNNVDSSAYARLGRHPWLARLAIRAGLLSEERRARLNGIAPGIIQWDLRRGIPFEDGSFDVVYHSHVLEHIPRDAACGFLTECLRVLKPGGVLRIAVPDLHRIATAYLAATDRIGRGDASAWVEYDAALSELLDQIVRLTPAGTAGQRLLVRMIERGLRGGARRAGEAHLWMYDEWSLGRLLERAGYGDVRREAFDTSRIQGWTGYGLDGAGTGPRKPDSVFVECARRPAVLG